MSSSSGPTVADRMRAALTQALRPETLEVIDDSHRHADHYVHAGGAGHEGQSHFSIRIVAEAFRGKTRVQRHRLVNDLLAGEFAAGVHALALTTKAPGE